MAQSTEVQKLVARMKAAEAKVASGQAELDAAKKGLAKLLLVGSAQLPKQTQKSSVPSKPKKKTARDDLAGRIRRFMSDGKDHSTKEVARALGEDRGRVGDAMKRMEARTKDLKRVSTGVYRARKATGNISAKSPSIKKGPRKKG